MRSGTSCCKARCWSGERHAPSHCNQAPDRTCSNDLLPRQSSLAASWIADELSSGICSSGTHSRKHLTLWIHCATPASSLGNTLSQLAMTALNKTSAHCSSSLMEMGVSCNTNRTSTIFDDQPPAFASDEKTSRREIEDACRPTILDGPHLLALPRHLSFDLLNRCTKIILRTELPTASLIRPLYRRPLNRVVGPNSDAWPTDQETQQATLA